MHLDQLSNKKILYAALDWGFGHVTRSIAIILELLEENNEVIIACNSEQKSLFISYLPNVSFLELDGYNFEFSGKGRWTWDLWKSRKHFFETIKKEQNFVEKTVLTNNIDVVISDHRYGFYSTKTPSIFVTHQLHLPIPKALFFIQKWHEKQINKFSNVWVLDSEDSLLAGKLSKKIDHPNLFYIGWKSRFTFIENKNYLYDYLVVLSGPKVYAEQLFNEIIAKFDLKNRKVAVLHPSNLNLPTEKYPFEFYPSSNLKQNDALFFQAETLISRSGYSTLMDLKVLDKKAHLIPTKGQKEQEYLCEHNKLKFEA